MGGGGGGGGRGGGAGGGCGSGLDRRRRWSGSPGWRRSSIRRSVGLWAGYRPRRQRRRGAGNAAKSGEGSLCYFKSRRGERGASCYPEKASQSTKRRDGRVVEGARLESVFRGNSNVGSNPTLSATLESTTYRQQPILVSRGEPIGGQLRPIMPLSLYRRHHQECTASRPRWSTSSEFQEKAKTWKRCGCPIIAAGSLSKVRRKRTTGQFDWEEARMMARRWETAGRWPDDGSRSEGPTSE